ncbi:MAG: hypothetical protein V3W04_04790 [Gammaproteobacteria bacterium]
MANNVTFRSGLVGGLADFCNESHLPLISNPLIFVELIVLLARYKEEGVGLHPKVYITNDINLCNAMIGNAEKIKIGAGGANEDGIKQAIKKCAPLAKGSWCIYIHDQNQSIEFGVFRGSSNITAVPIDDVLLSDNEGLIVVKAFQVADECVEVKCSNNRSHYIFLNHVKDDSPPPLQHLKDLVAAVCQKVVEDERESIESFLYNVLIEGLRESHGCLIAVTSMKLAPSILKEDGVFLEEPIDFVSLVSNANKDLVLFEYLVSKVDLLKGMLNSDGIILFDNVGRLLGYNCFIKISQKARVIGGARKRAYSSLKENVGKKGIVAAFMQSQDGWTEFEVKS